ncbi:MAG: PhoU domain-containing protein [Gemmatimonadota bacterium]|jgi:phosphate uptake regulator
MWKDILALFRGGGLCEEAFDEALLMLQASHGMYQDSIAALHHKGVLVDDIYARDRQINKYERSVRRKIVTHMSVSPKPDINMGLVLTAIVIDIERLGDYTKNIVELAVGLHEPFDGLELDDDVRQIESTVDAMFTDIIPALKESDEGRARKIIELHKQIGATVERDILLLRESKVLSGRSGHAVTVALHLRFLKRVSAHLKNVATSVVNPYYRIGFREKDVDVDAQGAGGPDDDE